MARPALGPLYAAARFAGRLVPWAALALGAAALAGCAALLAVALPDAQSRHDAYARAVPCAAGQEGQVGQDGQEGQDGPDCLGAARCTVATVHIRHTGKSSYYWADLTCPGAGTRRVPFDGDRPLLRTLHPGDAVTATSWRGKVVTLAAPGGTPAQRTDDDPADAPHDVTVASVIVGAVGILLVTVGCVELRRRRHRRVRHAVSPS
jgi:hypothetical protein